MLNDNRIIDYLNLFSFLHYQFSKWVLHWLQQKAWSGPCINSLLIIIAHVTLQVSGVCRPHCLYDVTTILASVCVVSLFKVLLSCSRVWTAFCDTLWHNTNAISIDIIIRRRETVRRHRRSICQSAISLLQASRQSLMGHHGVKIFDNRKKIDFQQTIIDFQ